MRRRLLLTLSAALGIVACGGASRSATKVGSPGFALPSGFSLTQIARLPGARELTFAPDGALFIGTGGGDVYILPHAENAAREPPRLFIHFDDAPAAGVVFARNHLYVGTQFAVWSIPYSAGDLRAKSPPVKLASVRTSGESRDHVTTSVAIAGSEELLYASVGSSCDACQPDLDETRATIGRIGGGKYTIIARGIRNAIALTGNSNTGSLWAGDAGQDLLPPGHPYEIFDDVSAHSWPVRYGWPNCYENHKRVGDNASVNCQTAAVPRVVFPAYSTPIGAVFYPQKISARHAFPAKYRGGAFVTLHGSWHGPPYVPPRVVFVPMHGDSPSTPVDWNDPAKQWTEFVGGFQSGDGRERRGRPTGIAVGPEGDLFVADDLSGAIYRIRAK